MNLRELGYFPHFYCLDRHVFDLLLRKKCITSDLTVEFTYFKETQFNCQ